MAEQTFNIQNDMMDDKTESTNYIVCQMARIRKRSRNLELDILRFVVSCAVGFVLFSFLFQNNRIVIRHPHLCKEDEYYDYDPTVETEDNNFVEKTLFIVVTGMMSTKENLQQRVLTSVNTWMRHIPKNVVIEVFASNDGSIDSSTGSKVQVLSNGVRVIELPGVKDKTYPPQKKSFSMIKYMHDHYLDNYQWFMRLDDDAYVKLDKLVQFLSHVNSSEQLFIGQPGFGRNELDYVGRNENYCMGGPGIIFSKELLSNLGNKLKYCLSEMLTDHEDVELGRCVIKSTQAKCTTAWDSNEYFLQNYPPKGSKEVVAPNIEHIDQHKRDMALTLHSNKDPEKQYLLHGGVLSDSMQDIFAKTKELRNEIDKMNNLLTMKKLNNNMSDNYMTWSYLHGKRNFHYSSRNLPEIARMSVIEHSMQQLTSLFYKTRRKEHKYLFAKFIGLDEIMYNVNPMTGYNVKATIVQEYKKKYGRVYQKKHLQWKVPFANDHVFFVQEHTSLKNSLLTRNEKVTFIVPVSGRITTLIRFLTNFEHEFLFHQENVNLILTVFIDDNTNDSPLNIATKSLETFQSNYKFFKSKILTTMEPFSRGLGLHLGIEAVAEHDDLLFFCDLDMIMTRQLVTNIRRNTIRGRQVYYPIVFGEFNPEITHATEFATLGGGGISEESGLFRTFSYGMVSLYKTDYENSDGFDLSIQGWGSEDVKFLSALQESGLGVFRSNEMGLIHGYHDKTCDVNSSQYRSCMMSRAQQIAPTTILSKIWRTQNKNFNDHQTLS